MKSLPDENLEGFFYGLVVQRLECPTVYREMRVRFPSGPQIGMNRHSFRMGEIETNE